MPSPSTLLSAKVYQPQRVGACTPMGAHLHRSGSSQTPEVEQRDIGCARRRASTYVLTYDMHTMHSKLCGGPQELPSSLTRILSILLSAPCMSVRMCSRLLVCAYLCVHVCACVCVQAHVHACVCACVRVFARACSPEEAWRHILHLYAFTTCTLKDTPS